MGGRPEGGADRCGAMHYATTSGIGSRIFCPAEKAMWEALRRTIECSSKPFCTDIEPAFLGVISLSALVIGRPSISASIDGRRAVLSSAFSRCFAVILADQFEFVEATNACMRARIHGFAREACLPLFRQSSLGSSCAPNSAQRSRGGWTVGTLKMSPALVSDTM